MRRRRHPFADRWNHNSHYYPTLREAVPDSARRVLDVGCGDGTLSRYLAGPGRLVVGLDVDAGHLAPESGLAYVVGSAEALGLADASFDALTMATVLHHVDAHRALSEAARVLRPGGLLQVLGIGAYGGVRDLPFELRDVVAHRLHSRSRTPWDPPTAKADPTQTWAEVRATVRHCLPGSTWQRLPLWRYRVTWNKPTT